MLGGFFMVGGFRVIIHDKISKLNGFLSYVYRIFLGYFIQLLFLSNLKMHL